MEKTPFSDSRRVRCGCLYSPTRLPIVDGSPRGAGVRRRALPSRGGDVSSPAARRGARFAMAKNIDADRRQAREVQVRDEFELLYRRLTTGDLAAAHDLLASDAVLR